MNGTEIEMTLREQEIHHKLTQFLRLAVVAFCAGAVALSL